MKGVKQLSGNLCQRDERRVTILWESRHAADDLALVFGVRDEFGEDGGGGPTSRSGPLSDRPVVDVPVRFVQELHCVCILRRQKESRAHGHRTTRRKGGESVRMQHARTCV